MSDIDEICAAIEKLPTLTIGNLKKLIGATETYADACNLYGDATPVQHRLIDALEAADDVRVYEGEQSAA